MNFDNEFDIQNYLSIFLRNKLYDQWSVGNLSLFTVYLHLILLIAMKIYLKYIQIVYWTMSVVALVLLLLKLFLKLNFSGKQHIENEIERIIKFITNQFT